jgi:hypothetical protein
MVNVLLASPTVIDVAAGFEGNDLVVEVPESVELLTTDDAELLLDTPPMLEADFVFVPLVRVKETDAEAGTEGIEAPAEVDTDVHTVLI